MNEMTRLVAAPDSYRARITSAEFLRMCEAGVFDDGKIELIDGELERMPPPYRAHSLRQGSIYAQLVAAFGADRVGLEIGIDLGSDTIVGCDVVLLKHPVTENRLLLPEDVALAIEVAETTLKKDTGVKLKKYAAAGIATYWVVDGGRSVTHVYSLPVENDYAALETVRFGGPLAVPGTDAVVTVS